MAVPPPVLGGMGVMSRDLVVSPTLSPARGGPGARDQPSVPL